MAFITKSYTFHTPAGTVLKNANVSVYFNKTSTAARVFDAGQNLKDTAPQLTTDDTGYVLMYFDDDDFQTGQTFDLVASPDARCNPTENEVHLIGVGLTTNWSEIADDDGHKPADDADETSASNQGVSWLNEAVGSVLPVANTDAKCTDATADKTSTHTAADAAAYTGASISTTKTDAKCTDALADQTSVSTADNTDHVNDSETDAGHHYDCSEDILMRSGADISFYIKPAAVQVYVGRVLANSTGIWIYSSDNPITLNTEQTSAHSKSVECKSDFIPWAASTYYLGDATYRWARAYVDAYYVGTTAGCDFSGAVSNITVVKGLVTAAS